ncbi:uncharacterized protein LOC129357640 [Poeciliopsis prolifica]|uniref:uncharacterized protein LOC129357640 n=1 Tax=Poeciliopsis prolifica TaxID=188132 RepID=UPI002414022B|nr:uncharacterized protein LOC129357640 [Poeciliopsis prolifica]
MQRQRRINPKEDAKYYIDTKTDKVGLDVKYISAFKGRGIFATTSFQKGDFLCEYRGELISKEESGNTEQIRPENDQDEMSTSVPNETDPVLDSLPINSEVLEKEMSQSPDCAHSMSTVGNTEQIRPENDQDEMSTSVPNETDPVLNSFPINSEVLEKEISQSPDCTHSMSTAGNTEQIRPENDQDEMSTSVPNETDPVLDSLPINSQVLEKEMSQSPDCTHSMSTAGNTEQDSKQSDLKMTRMRCQQVSQMRQIQSWIHSPLIHRGWRKKCLKVLTVLIQCLQLATQNRSDLKTTRIRCQPVSEMRQIQSWLHSPSIQSVKDIT